MSEERYPEIRMRRLRQSGWIRDLVQENHIRASDLILPLFIIDGANQKQDIPSLPGVSRLSIDLAIEQIKKSSDLGIKAFALFPVTDPEKKDEAGSEAINPENLICKAVQSIKNECPNVGLIADVALDPYTSHGHDGILKDGIVLNDETVEALTKQSLCLSNAGADILAPSDMMDGRIKAIRKTLEQKRHQNTLILSYAAKFASHFYGPFRDAVGSANVLTGDKKTYQINPANHDEAVRDALMDIAEGADMLMVKPGLPYLDVIRTLKFKTNAPVFAYHVSGEYASLKAAAEKGWLDYELCLYETIIAFKRAGADAILSYGAHDLAQILNQK